MNRSVLIIICDFLLLSLLALVRFDQPPPEEEAPEPKREVVQEASQADLVEVLRLSLESEALAKQQLQQQISDQASLIEERESRVSQLEMTKEELLAQQQRLQELRDQLAADRERLASRMEQTQSQLQAAAADQIQLRETLAATQERQRLLQEQLQQREQELALTREEREALQRQREELARERAILATRLESAQVAQERLLGEVEALRVEKQAVQQQAEQLSRNVGELAQATQQVGQQITTQIEKSTPLSVNAIYSNFRKNRVPAAFKERSQGLLGPISSDTKTNSIIVAGSDGVLYALFEASETPFRPNRLGNLLEVHGQIQVSQNLGITSVSFLREDPRIIAVRLPPQYVREAGIQTFSLSEEPLRFETAVVIQASGERYGEAEFTLNTSDPRYLEMKGGTFSSLFGGAFNPSRGDFVFSRSGAVIGFMIDNNRAVIIPRIDLAVSMPIGDRFQRSEAQRAQQEVQQLMPRSL